MKAYRGKMPSPSPISTILQKALKSSHIEVDLDLHLLWSRWTDLVGPVIAQNARPAAIKRGLLLVNVSSAPWMQQLHYLKSELKEKLNLSLGREAVIDIRFKVGPLEQSQD